MKAITIGQVAQAVGGEFIGDPEYLERSITAVCTDSRVIDKGGLFIAIKGARSDGFDYIYNAFQKGAAACLTDRLPAYPMGPCVIVKDVTSAIQALAAYYRSLFDIPFIGITGSVGKTTAKEMVASVLSQRFSVLKTPGNFNNDLGVPLTLFGLESHHQAAVIEMGISHFGEMHRLAKMVKPDIALITVIGYSHLEFLQNRDGVFKEKSSIFDLVPKNGLAILNGDDDLLAGFDPGVDKIIFGLSKGCDYTAENIRSLGLDGVACDIVYKTGRINVKIPAFGSHVVMAALPAAAIGRYMGLTDREIKAGIENFQNVGRRASIRIAGSVHIVDDCYNANPSSVKAALDSMRAANGRKVCILGDMKELGDGSQELHRMIGEYAREAGMDLVIACGEDARAIASSAGNIAMYFKTVDDLIPRLSSIIKDGDTVLVKASHSMNFDQITEAIINFKK